MADKQVVQPNLDPYIVQPNGKGGEYVINDWLGMCDAYVEQAFGFKYLAPTATALWNAAQVKHRDRSFPSGVYIPLYFSWSKGTQGHVVIYKDGVMWSSPISHKPTADVWHSIEQIEANYSCSYLGWSEDLAGHRVIEPVATPTPVTPQGGDDVITADKWPLIQLGTRRIKYWEPDQAQEMRAWGGQTFEKWLSEGFIESVARWQEREDAFNALPAVTDQLGTAQKALEQAQQQATEFGASNVDLSTQVADLQAQLTRSQAETKAIKEGYTKLQEQRTPVAAPAPTLADYSLGELLSAAFNKLFKIK